MVVSFLLLARAAAAATTITLLHFSDYHSHALPFYSEDRADQGGIARAIRYLRGQKRAGALVFNGGDMMNRGAPAWSDKYGCAEWPWLNGIVDAMAFGNHEADYGVEQFNRCRALVDYPILSANIAGFQPYEVFVVRGIRIGVFALAGPDFPALTKLPQDWFSDRIAVAGDVVRRLKDQEAVDAVVMIGHEHAEDDFALARAVPGIDLIFGTHSHWKQELMQIPGTSTWFISPYQYLAYISRVELTFDGGRITGARGRLVVVDDTLPGDRRVSRLVDAMQQKLERDPAFENLFVKFGSLPAPMPIDRLAQHALDAARMVTRADIALSTVSSFRQPLPAGPIDLELLRNAMPYDNEIVVVDMPPAMAEKLLALVKAQSGTDAAAYVTGGIKEGAQSVRIATTDYMAGVAPAYRDFFAGFRLQNTGIRLRHQVRKSLMGSGLEN